MKKLLIVLLSVTSIVSPLFSSAQERAASNAGSRLKLDDVRTDTEKVAFLINVARAYLQDNELDECINAFERALEIDPNNHDANYILSFVYINAKKYKEAEELLFKLAKIFPDDFKIWNNIAWLYATAEDPNYRDGKKAVKYAHEAMVLAPTDHHVWSTLSEAYYVCGEYEKANRSILHMVALVQNATGLTQESVDEYNKQLRKCRRALDAHNAMKKDK